MNDEKAGKPAPTERVSGVFRRIRRAAGGSGLAPEVLFRKLGIDGVPKRLEAPEQKVTK